MLRERASGVPGPTRVANEELSRAKAGSRRRLELLRLVFSLLLCSLALLLFTPSVRTQSAHTPAELSLAAVAKLETPRFEVGSDVTSDGAGTQEQAEEMAYLLGLCPKTGTMEVLSLRSVSGCSFTLPLKDPTVRLHCAPPPPLHPTAHLQNKPSVSRLAPADIHSPIHERSATGRLPPSGGAYLSAEAPRQLSRFLATLDGCGSPMEKRSSCCEHRPTATRQPGPPIRAQVSRRE
ncbi:MAG: hypothetical protein SGPRY_005029 [Prymnesium sp.]